MDLPNPPFVKKFDFRGVYGKDLTDQDAYYLAKAFQKVLPLKKILLGWDTRESSKSLALNFINALKDTNIEIYFLDKVSIDYVTAGAFSFNFDLSVMFTGSHNTWEWTGLLVHTKKGVSLQGKKVEKIVAAYHQVKNTPYLQPAISLTDYKDFLPEIEQLYRKKIQTLIPLHEIKPAKIVVDLGDGSGTKALNILETLLPQITITRLNDRGLYNQDTAHTTDPSEVKNMQQLIEKMQEGRYDAGFAFDSDADRVLAVDEKGQYLNGSVLATALTQSSVMLGLSTRTIGYAVETGPSLYNAVTEINRMTHEKIKITPIPVGRSLVRQLVKEGKIDIGVENVGHFYFKDFFMTDSGVFSIALILYWMSMNGSLSKLTKKYPDGQRTQGSFPLADKKADDITTLAETINAHFKDKKIKKIEVDGQRYEIFNGEVMESWFALRKSGYEALEKYYFGSLHKEDFAYLEEQFAKLLTLQKMER